MSPGNSSESGPVLSLGEGCMTFQIPVLLDFGMRVKTSHLIALVLPVSPLVGPMLD